MVIPNAYIGAKLTDWPRNGADSPWGNGGPPIQPADLLLVGNPGCGKTRCLWACAQTWRLNSIVLKAEAMVSQFSAAQSFKAEMTAEDLMDTWVSAPLLCIDDLGASRSNELAMATILRVLSEREERGLPTIVTTNVGRDGYDPRIQSRLGAYRVLKFPAIDYRKTRGGEIVTRVDDSQPISVLAFLERGRPIATRWLAMSESERRECWRLARTQPRRVLVWTIPDRLYSEPSETECLTHANLIEVILTEATHADRLEAAHR